VVIGASLELGAFPIFILSNTGPASLMLIDPNGNPVIIDQHVASTADL
jgi:hypothetical protein